MTLHKTWWVTIESRLAEQTTVAICTRESSHGGHMPDLARRPIVLMIDDHNDNVGEIRSQLGSVGHSGHKKIDRNQSVGGGEEKVIIGVGTSQFMWVYGQSEFPEDISGFSIPHSGWLFPWVLPAYLISCHDPTQSAATRTCRQSH